MHAVNSDKPIFVKNWQKKPRLYIPINDPAEYNKLFPILKLLK